MADGKLIVAVLMLPVLVCGKKLNPLKEQDANLWTYNICTDSASAKLNPDPEHTETMPYSIDFYKGLYIAFSNQYMMGK